MRKLLKAKANAIWPKRQTLIYVTEFKFIIFNFLINWNFDCKTCFNFLNTKIDHSEKTDNTFEPHF